jgi:coenzyme PQQ precursor peptide PqqA
MAANGRPRSAAPATSARRHAMAGTTIREGSQMKKVWKAPQVIEKPVSLEVTMYLPAGT